jgi:hypothetical protein
MKIEIVDNFKDKSEPKPIKLVYCLQISRNPKTGLPEWALIEKPNFNSYLKLIRIGKHKIDFDEYDVIIAEHTRSMGGYQTFWLGHWNDGVVSE